MELKEGGSAQEAAAEGGAGRELGARKSADSKECDFYEIKEPSPGDGPESGGGGCEPFIDTNQEPEHTESGAGAVGAAGGGAPAGGGCERDKDAVNARRCSEGACAEGASGAAEAPAAREVPAAPAPTRPAPKKATWVQQEAERRDAEIRRLQDEASRQWVPTNQYHNRYLATAASAAPRLYKRVEYKDNARPEKKRRVTVLGAVRALFKRMGLRRARGANK